MKELIILTKVKELYFNIDKISINIPKKYKFEKEIRKSINIIDYLIEYGLTNKFISYHINKLG